MKRSTWLVALAAALAVTAGLPALATDNSQQDKMTSCNADATSKGLKGDDRKAFMKTCLSSQPAAASKTNSQQEKMKSCNADATTKGLKGDDRKAFMKTCLSSQPAATTH
jgi:hypothetical protein